MYMRIVIWKPIAIRDLSLDQISPWRIFNHYLIDTQTTTSSPCFVDKVDMNIQNELLEPFYTKRFQVSMKSFYQRKSSSSRKDVSNDMFEYIFLHVGTNDLQKCNQEVTVMNFSGSSWLPML